MNKSQAYFIARSLKLFYDNYTPYGKNHFSQKWLAEIVRISPSKMIDSLNYWWGKLLTGYQKADDPKAGMQLAEELMLYINHPEYASWDISLNRKYIYMLEN